MAESSGRRWSRIFKPDARAEVDEELAFHLEQRVRDNLARGMAPEAALAAAEQRLGDLKLVQRECVDLLGAERRAEARRAGLRFSWLDFKLGFRMLAKYPGLTVVGGIAIAFAMALGAFAFEFMVQVMRPSIPLPDGDRIVALRLWDTAENEQESRALHDFTVWGIELKSVEELSVFRDLKLNLIGRNGVGLPVATAQITASGFRLARVAPVLGRTLIEDDQRAGAVPVVLLGEGVWRTHFDADPNIIGRIIRLSGEQRTVVGVMPEPFAFPLYHSAWIPFGVEPAYEPLQGPDVGVFGRLASGMTMEQAQAELTGLGERAAKDSPASHEHLRPQVLPFTDSVFDMEPIVASYFINSFVGMFLVLIYANVALLMFGRTATRENEIVVRNALGASRGRILTQLFTEALVLGATGAVIGLIVARFGVSWAFNFLALEVDLPFWYRERLSPLTLLYAVGLTMLAALVAGVIPALKVTRAIGTQLRAASAGSGGLQFGRLWTGIIVAQVAFTVAFFPILITVGDLAWRANRIDLGFPAQEYLALRLERAAGAERTDARGRAAIYQDLKRRVSAEPGVTAVTYASQLPGVYHDRPAIEVEGVPALPSSGVRPRAQRATVDLVLFLSFVESFDVV
jgi:predicted permease